MRVAHHVIHQADLALGGCQGLERGADRVPIDDPMPLPAAWPAVRLVQGDVNAASLAISSNIETGVHQDAVDPRGRCRLAAELTAVRKRTEIGLLHEIVDIIAANESRGDAAQLTVRLDIRVSDRLRHVIS